MKMELSSDENQVVNLLLFGCSVSRRIAHILDTTEADIEDRLLGIMSKWGVKDIPGVIAMATEQGYVFFSDGSEPRKVTKIHLELYFKYHGDRNMMLFLGTNEDHKLLREFPWKELQLCMKLAEWLSNSKLAEQERNRYENALQCLCEEDTILHLINYHYAKNREYFRMN